MKTFFFEILSEEIPARMQKNALKDLKRLLEEGLKESQLPYESIETFITPRRLVGVVRDLPEVQADKEVSFRGPRVDAPSQAIEGFLKSQGLSSLECCSQEETSKGTFWFYQSLQKGKRTHDLLGPLLSHLIKVFPWPKSMRWGNNGNLSWVRPLRGLLVLFGSDVVPLTLGEGPWKIDSTRTSRGHTFLSPEPFEAENFEDYVQKLRERFVLLKEEDRAKVISQESLKIVQGRGELIEDKDLLEEVTGLVEWPVSLLGSIPQVYMELPKEVLRASLKLHQRYFSLEVTEQKKLAPYFIVVTNGFSPSKAVEEVLKGNENVLNARLSDALFFWMQDQKVPLEKMLLKLKTRVFQNKLGSLYEKAERLKALCEGKIGAIILKEHNNIKEGALEGLTLNEFGRAGFLAKADLTSAMVGEFPELQGIMGSYYASLQGESLNVSEALRDQYASLGPDSKAPQKPISVTLALADRIDTLFGLFGIGIFPTGSKDPYALRRLALGILKLLRENKLNLSLKTLIESALDAYKAQGKDKYFKDPLETVQKLIEFFEERLKFSLKDQGISPDRVEACFVGNWSDNISRTCLLAEELDLFLKTEEGRIFLLGYRRASHILKEMTLEASEINPEYFEDPSEEKLLEKIQSLQYGFEKTDFSCPMVDFKSAFSALADLSPFLNTFFEAVQINSSNTKIRENRGLLLKEAVFLFERFADFSRIEKEGRSQDKNT